MYKKKVNTKVTAWDFNMSKKYINHIFSFYIFKSFQLIQIEKCKSLVKTFVLVYLYAQFIPLILTSEEKSQVPDVMFSHVRRQ